MVAVAVTLAVTTSGASSRPDYSAWQWFNHYYENPQPDLFVESMFELSRNGHFEQPYQISVALGFITSLLRQNPDRVDEWLLYCRALPERHQRLVFAALWYAGHPKGTEILQTYAETTENPRLRTLLEGLLASSSSFDQAQVNTSLSLHVQWGVFLATGDQAPLQAIFAAVGDNHQIPLQLRWQLMQDAARHERVRDYCEQLAEHEPGLLGEVMRTVLLEHAAAAPRF